MNSVPGKSWKTNTVFAVCAQRVSSDIVPDIGGERFIPPPQRCFKCETTVLICSRQNGSSALMFAAQLPGKRNRKISTAKLYNSQNLRLGFQTAAKGSHFRVALSVGTCPP